MTVDLILRSKLILIFRHIIRTQEDTGLHMPQEHGRICSNNLTLHLESIIRIWGVDYPHRVVIKWCGGSASNLSLRDWSTDGCSILIAAEAQLLPEEVFVGLDAHFLPEADELVAAEHVDIIDSAKLVDGACHGSRVLTFTRARHLVSLWNIGALVANVNNQPALCVLVLNHHGVAPSELAVRVITPWHLPI